MAASEQRYRDYSANDDDYDRARPVKKRRFEGDDESHESANQSRHYGRYERHEGRGHHRSASPDMTQRDREGDDAAKDEHRQRHRKRHRHHHHHHHRSSRPAPPAELPYGARPISKSDLDLFRPLLARYIDVQKNKDMGDMDEREIRGRWKSFAAKWNEGTLAQSWYDPELFEETRQSGFWDVSSKPKATGRSTVGTEDASSAGEEDNGDGTARNKRSGNADSEGDDDEADDYGPVLPGSSQYRSSDRHGPGIPSLQDLEVRREMDEEDGLDSVSRLRMERKADRAEQKARLEELVPRAEAGTRERKLEKKKEVNEKMKGFRERSPGGATEVNDGELMGGGDSVEELKRMRASAERKKTEKEIRREEIRRAKDEERKEKLREYREKEDKAMVILKELAKQRFG
ncbi:hypothetical protein PFICI_10293 [Pestalotiopsis fici W106-1]|uniref:Uncharacterized protein n=1 Tax=Pestalotiopsis fici (strain W106-1 / CGMCC3.15140) TaxID=1229662 RepID=W3WZD4_PESFW|nr:uncharacterized protein PFICI_10293 [Pestalotiopsis fici W106-1]ETS78231.1 hypothetical protein PFICI_10293 [Pestalotiopsis fici W106-1]